MEQDDWTSGSQAIGMYLNGDGIAGKDARGRTITDDHFLIYFNADGPAEVTLPPDEFARAWDVVIDTSGAADTASTMAASKTFQIDTRTVVVLQEHAEPEDEPDHSVAASIAALAQTGATSPAAERRSGSRPTKVDHRSHARHRATPAEHLPAAGHPRVRPVRSRRGGLPYLHDLGVDWVYLSPLLQATSGSSHGYDVVDPTRVDESRGGAAGLAALSTEARRLGMGVLVDIVPNHMGVADPQQNAWWWDLLRLGRASTYAAAFDVDWDALRCRPGDGPGAR